MSAPAAAAGPPPTGPPLGVPEPGPRPSLVAAREDSTTAVSGVPALESGRALLDAVESGSWRDGALAGLGAGLEVAAAVLDPLGTLVAAGVGWLMEHVQPLSDLLDALTGDPDAVAAQARTWRNVAAAVRAAGDDLARASTPAPDWTGAAADGFARAGEARADDVRATAAVADALGAAVDGAGAVVSVVRETVRELIAELVATLVARVPQWTLEEVGTLGIATPHVVAAASAVVAKVTRRVVRLVEGLVRSLRSLGDLVGRVHDLARRLLPETPASAVTTPAPTVAARATPDPGPPGGGASPPDPTGTAAPTAAARATPDPTPSPGAGPPTSPAPGASGPPPGDPSGIGRIRAALEPEPPTTPTPPPTTPASRPLNEGLPPVAPGTRTLVDRLPESRLTRGPDGLIETIDGRPYRDVVRDLGRQRADEFRAARQSQQMSAKAVGPVASVALDRRTGRIVESTNGRRLDVIAREHLHPSMTSRVRELTEPEGRFQDTNSDGTVNRDGDGNVLRRDHPHPDDPLRHAEVKAVNELLNARAQAGPDAGTTTFSDFVVDNYYPFRGDGVSPAPCCANCSALLDGVDALPGHFDTYPSTGPPRGSR